MTLDIVLLAENRVRLPDGHEVTSHAPILAACRKALRRGLALPETPFRARWLGAPHDAVTGTVGVAAGLTVVERDRDIIRFQRHRPHGESPAWRTGRRRKLRPIAEAADAHTGAAPFATAA